MCVVPNTMIAARCSQRKPEVVSAQRKSAFPDFPSHPVKKKHMAGKIQFPLKPPIHIPTDVNFSSLNLRFQSSSTLAAGIFITKGYLCQLYTVQPGRCLWVYFEVYNPTHSKYCQRSNQEPLVLLLSIQRSFLIARDLTRTTIHPLFALQHCTSSTST